MADRDVQYLIHQAWHIDGSMTVNNTVLYLIHHGYIHRQQDIIKKYRYYRLHNEFITCNGPILIMVTVNYWLIHRFSLDRSGTLVPPHHGAQHTGMNM